MKMSNVSFTIQSRPNYFLPDPETRIWSFDLDEYEEVQKKVSALNPLVAIGPIPQFVLKLLRQGKLQLTAYDETVCFSAITKKKKYKTNIFQTKQSRIFCASMQSKSD